MWPILTIILVGLLISEYFANRRNSKAIEAYNLLIKYHQTSNTFLWSMLIEEVGVKKAAEDFLHYANQVVGGDIVLKELYAQAGISGEELANREHREHNNAKALHTLEARLRDEY